MVAVLPAAVGVEARVSVRAVAAAPAARRKRDYSTLVAVVAVTRRAALPLGDAGAEHGLARVCSWAETVEAAHRPVRAPRRVLYKDDVG